MSVLLFRAFKAVRSEIKSYKRKLFSCSPFSLVPSSRVNRKMWEQKEKLHLTVMKEYFMQIIHSQSKQNVHNKTRRPKWENMQFTSVNDGEIARLHLTIYHSWITSFIPYFPSFSGLCGGWLCCFWLSEYFNKKIDIFAMNVICKRPH